MSKAETWRDAARQQNEANLLGQADLLSKLAESTEILAESLAKLSEETREALSALRGTSESLKEELTRSGDAHRTALQEMTTASKETRSALLAWKDRLESSVSESERRINRSLRGVKSRLWLAMIGSAVLTGALAGWLTWRWSGQRQEETESAYRAGVKAAIEELSRSYTIRAKTTPGKPSGRSSGPSGASGSTSGSGTRSPGK